MKNNVEENGIEINLLIEGQKIIKGKPVRILNCFPIGLLTGPGPLSEAIQRINDQLEAVSRVERRDNDPS